MRATLFCVVATIGLTGFYSTSLLASDLTPPAGPVADTGVTNIFALPFAITQPGSYRLAADLTGAPASDGITITASGVVLDLGGHSITGPATNDAIALGPLVFNVTIRNGTIGKWSTAVILNIGALVNQNIRIEGLQINNCALGINIFAEGTTVSRCQIDVSFANGIALGSNSLVEDCTVNGGGGAGILVSQSSVVRNCTVTNNSSSGITALQGSTIENCVARGNAGTGIFIAGGVIRGCSAFENGVVPVRAARSSVSKPTDSSVQIKTVRGVRQLSSSSTRAATTAGIEATNGSIIVDSVARGNLGDGILLSGNIQACSVSGTLSVDNGAVGIRTFASGGQIIGCTADGNAFEGILVQAGSSASILDCFVRDNLLDGIQVGSSSLGGTTIRGATVIRNSGDGINATDNTTIEQSLVRNNSLLGIRAGTRVRIVDCHVSTNTLGGIEVATRCMVTGTTCDDNGVPGGVNLLEFGIHITAGDNVVDLNRVSFNGGHGILVNGTFNQVTRNSIVDDSISVTGANNRIGTLAATPVGAGAWDNIAF